MTRWTLTAAVLLATGCTSVAAPKPRSTPNRSLDPSVPRPPPSTELTQAISSGQRAGAGQQLVLKVDSAATGDHVSAPIGVPKDRCVLILARAGASVSDLDLYAYAEDGAVLGSDEQPDNRPGLMICPPHPGRVFAAARVAGGFGLVSLGAVLVSPTASSDVSKALDLKRGAPRVNAWAELNDALAAHQAPLGGDWKEQRRIKVALTDRVPTLVPVSIDSGECADILVVPERTLTQLDVVAISKDGVQIGRAQPAGRNRAIIVCSQQRVDVTIELRPHAGRGSAALAIATTRATPAEIDAPAVLFTTYAAAPLKDAVSKRITATAELGLGRPVRVAALSARFGRRTSHTSKFPVGCHHVEIVGGKPVRGLTAWFYDTSRRLVAHQLGVHNMTAFVCTPGGDVRVDLEALQRTGPVQILRRSIPQSHPLFVAHPLAAGRLLGALYARGTVATVARAMKPSAAVVRHDSLATARYTVAAGRCVEWIAALDRGADSLEVRSMDDETDRELARVLVPAVAAQRFCADAGRTVKLRFEMRTLGGSATALHGGRLVPIAR